MRLRMMHRYHPYDAQPERPSAWTAGLLGSAIGMLVVGVAWYLQTRAKARPLTPQQLGWSRQGQAPSRAHIQLSSHVANRYHAEPR